MVAYVFAGLLLLIFISLPTYKIYLKYSTSIKTPNGISSLEEIVLGGFKQWIFIRGTDQKNPILMFLHGGPGEPALGMSSSRHLDAELIEHFTVVHWDQRGAGKSYSSDIPVDSMTFGRLVEDCDELIDYLRSRFNAQKVILVAHSGGTPIGIRTAHKYPEKIHAYVGVAQVINDYEQERQSYEFLVEEAEKSRDVRKQAAIKAIGPPPYETPEKFFKKAGHIVRLGGFIHHNLIKHMAFVILSYLTSPEYSLSDGLNIVSRKGLNFTTNARWEEIKNIDFTKEIQSIKVPIYFFMGTYDMITPTVQVEDFFNRLDAEKGKKLIIFENSAHLPIIEEKKKYQDLLVNVVLKQSHSQ
jgi:proline iminopeptidase